MMAQFDGAPLDLDADPAAIAAQLAADPLLADLLERHPGVRVPGFGHLSAARAVLGVRAEDLRVVAPEDGQIVQPVFSFELTGDATLVTVQVGKQAVTARAGKSLRLAMGERVGLAADAQHCYLFDADSQARLRPA